MTWSNGKHAFYGKRNDRARRSRSKIIKGIKNIARIEDFKKIEAELRSGTSQVSNSYTQVRILPPRLKTI